MCFHSSHYYNVKGRVSLIVLKFSLFAQLTGCVIILKLGYTNECAGEQHKTKKILAVSI